MIRAKPAGIWFVMASSRDKLKGTSATVAESLDGPYSLLLFRCNKRFSLLNIIGMIAPAITTVTGRDEVFGIVIGRVLVKMVRDQGALFGPSIDQPSYRTFAPMTGMRTGTDLGKEY